VPFQVWQAHRLGLIGVGVEEDRVVSAGWPTEFLLKALHLRPQQGYAGGVEADGLPVAGGDVRVAQLEGDLDQGMARVSCAMLGPAGAPAG
jgi:hypothetical protein